LTAERFEDGPCSSCGAPGELRAGGLLGQVICPHCTLANEVAPEVLAGLLGLNAGNVVELDGTRIDLTTPLGAVLLARKLSERHRRLGSAGLFDWSGAVTFPQLRPSRRAVRRCGRAC
jgi:hypothetical protein